MRFNLHALDSAQQVVALSLDAASEAAAREVAGSRGLAVFSVAAGGRHWQPRLAKKSAFRPALFSIELRSLLDAGLNLVEALQTLSTFQRNWLGNSRGFVQLFGPPLSRLTPQS